SFEEATQLVSETYHELKKILEKKYHSSSVGDEGGFTPKIKYPEQALDLILKAINNLDYEKKIKLAIDVAASEFYYKNKYFIPKKMNSSRLIDYYLNLIKTYPIISLEDPFEQDDFEAFKELTKKSHIQIVGDDLLTTNISRIKIAIEKKLCNCLLLKVNQIGTLTESIKACKLAQKNNMQVMVSHRSGETEDSFISDLAVALNCKQIKLGAPCRGERTCKYNQLLRIAEDKKLKYPKIFFNRC
ncbi:MAG TPA: enolase C-terminal domain-like protein, partial [Candidatus Nanoarchaeia archaeon]|nr:enolase C-terminal domain-like protein [Candidatus Nanoarchaeia archaeon]